MMNHTFVEFNGLKIKFRQNSADEKVLGHSFENDIFFKEVPDFKGSKNSVVVDVGAHIGTFSLLAYQLLDQVKVFALEPNDQSYRLLEENVKSNNLITNIIPINAALNDSTGKIKLYLDTENWGHSITNTSFGEYEEIDSITLAELIRSHSISKIDLLKMNCEGAEFKILLSLTEKELSMIGMAIVLFHEDLIDTDETNRHALISFFKKGNFYVRLVNATENRGWIIAKNKKVYGFWGNLIFGTKAFFRVHKTKIIESNIFAFLK